MCFSRYRAIFQPHRLHSIYYLAIAIVVASSMGHASAAPVSRVVPKEDMSCTGYSLPLNDVSPVMAELAQNQRLDTVVRLFVDERGALTDAIIEKSSGNPAFDLAALRASRSAICKPYSDADGKPVPVESDFTYFVANGMPPESGTVATEAAAASPASTVTLPPALQKAIDQASLQRFGVTPGSTKAEIVVRWSKKIAEDPDIRQMASASPVQPGVARLNGALTAQAALTGVLTLTTEDRARMLELTSRLLDGVPADCGGLKSLPAVMQRYMLPTLSDDDVNDYLRLSFTTLKQTARHAPTATVTEEQRQQGEQVAMGTLGLMLKSNPTGASDLTALLVNEAAMTSIQWCNATRLSQRALIETPQPFRDWAIIGRIETARKLVGIASASVMPSISRPLPSGVYSSAHPITINGVKVQTNGYIEIDHAGRITAFEQEGEGSTSIGSGCYLLAAGTATNAGLQGRILTLGVSPRGDTAYQTRAGDYDTFGILVEPAANGGMRWFFHWGGPNSTVTLNGSRNVANSSNRSSYSISGPALASPTPDQLRSMLCRADK